MTPAAALSPPTDRHPRLSYLDRSPDDLEAIAMREPENPAPLYLLSYLLRRRDDPRWQDVALAASHRPHTTPQHIYGRSVMKVLRGDWSGWVDHEARFQGPDTIKDLYKYSPLCWKHQRWDGREDLSGKTLLILPEQGIGDCLQMWRFLPALFERVGSPILMVYPRLVPFARHNFADRAQLWLDNITPTMSFDRYVWSMSLPAIFGSLPRFTPLSAPRKRRPLPSRQRPIRCGLCWAGSPDYPQDFERSIGVAELHPLLARDDVEWVSFQVGSAAKNIETAVVRSPDPSLVTFADTADLLMEVDCLVTVDTSVAHLAGLLGVPTYLVLQSDSHWRWGLEETTPWYPSMRLIRQRTFGDWGSVVRDVNRLFDERA
jgi:hypothetical protein